MAGVTPCPVCGRPMPLLAFGGERCGYCASQGRVGSLALACLRECHRAFDLPVRTRPEIPGEDEVMLRHRLIKSESSEALEILEAIPEGPELGTPEGEWTTKMLAALGLELADILYVVYGTAVQFGIPLDRIFAEVHASQFTKLGEDGRPIKDEGGKFLKGPNYVKPDVVALIEEALDDPR